MRPVQNILVVYYVKEARPRATVLEHLYSFRAHADARCFYLNMAAWRTPQYLARVEFDAIIFDYTIASMRNMPELFRVLMGRLDFIRRSTATKMLVPQDEYIHGDQLCWMIDHFKVDYVYSLVDEAECRRIYREADFDRVQFDTVLTGYVSDRAVRRVGALSRSARRDIDVGYRSWDPWPCLGRHGRLKGDVGHIAKAEAERAGLAADVSHNYERPILGDDWYRFLLRCRYVVGVEGGSSVLDYDGVICENTRAFLAQYPTASFEQVEKEVFPGAEGTTRYIMLSPRHIECCLTRTGQALIEGDYNGVLKPGEHYLEIRKDFSNIQEVISAMESEDARLAMVDRAYRDIVASGEFSYRRFVAQVLQPIQSKQPHEVAASQTVRMFNRAAFVRCRIADALLPLRWHARGVLQRFVGAQRLQAFIELLKGRTAAAEVDVR